MKTILVPVEEFLANDGVLKPNRRLYDETGIEWKIRVPGMDNFIKENLFVKIKCTPIYK